MRRKKFRGRLGEEIPAQPFADWIEAQVRAYDRAQGDVLVETRGGHSWLAHRLWPELTQDAANRRLYKFRYRKRSGGAQGRKGEFVTSTFPKISVEEALDQVGVRLWELYPDIEEEEADDFEPDAFCYPCWRFIPPIDDKCPYCERPVERLNLASLPPREGEVVELVEEKPEFRVDSRPRHKYGRPFYFDVLIDRRRVALETMAGGAGFLVAARKVWEGAWSSPESCASALRSLCEREGWHEKSATRGGSPRAKAGRLRRTRQRIRQALADGTWDRVVVQQPAPSQRTIFDERFLHEAAWLYYYDELSFSKIATRMLPLANTKRHGSLKTALCDEWNRRGWPKRTDYLHGTPKPTKDRQCIQRVNGKRCQRWAVRGHRKCNDHLADRAALRRRKAAHASAGANRDAVPVAPFGWWILKRVEELGSLAEFHRRVEGAISYHSLQGWVHVWGRKQPGEGRQKRVRRRTVDRILEAWGDGTTFEDIYLPVDLEADRKAA